MTSRPPKCVETLTRYGRLMQVCRYDPLVNADYFDPIRKEPRFVE